MSERIICAAVHVDDGREHVHQPKNIKSGFVIAGRRHHNTMYTPVALTGMSVTTVVSPERIQTGFLTNTDYFLNREDAWKVAEMAGQIIEREHQIKGTLYSEDLY